MAPLALKGSGTITRRLTSPEGFDDRASESLRCVAPAPARLIRISTEEGSSVYRRPALSSWEPSQRTTPIQAREDLRLLSSRPLERLRWRRLCRVSAEVRDELWSRLVLSIWVDRIWGVGRPRRSLTAEQRELLDRAFEAQLALEHARQTRDRLARQAAELGASWREIAAAVNMSPQAAHKRYAAHP